jgi:hypothetical protein
MRLLGFVQWLQQTAWATAFRESTLAYPIVEGIHLLALSASVGLIAICDLRLMGIALTTRPASEVLKYLRSGSLIGFTVMFASGALLFAAAAEKCYYNEWFRLKVLLLFLAGVNALVFNLTVYRNITAWDVAGVPPLAARRAGLFSLILWALVIVAGRTTAYNL